MGYNHYFSLVDKEEVDKVRNLSYQEIINYAKEHYPQSVEEKELDSSKVDICFHFFQFLSQEEIYDFGRIYSDIDKRIYSKGEPLFSNKEMQEYLEEYTPYLMGKEGMLEAIECYKDKIINYYTRLLKKCKGEEVESFRDSPEMFIRRKISEWSFKGTADINSENDFLTYSGDYEMAIFNLLYLLKTIDWNRKALLFYGC